MAYNASVKGGISGGSTSASISAKVSFNYPQPSGTVSGKLSFIDDKGIIRTFRYSSNNAEVVGTIRSPRSVGAKFANVTLRDSSSSTVYRNCELTMDATRINATQWIGSFTLICPEDRNLFIYGTFTGTVFVNVTATQEAVTLVKKDTSLL